MPPAQPPIGRAPAGAARAVSRAFDEALVAAGGSPPTSLVLLWLRTGPVADQREPAAGVRGATPTHHLDAVEADGPFTRRRDPASRRAHVGEPTAAGEAAFPRLPAEHGARPRAGFADAEPDLLREPPGRRADATA